MPCGRIIKDRRVLHLNRAGPERSRLVLRVILNEVEYITSFHSSLLFLRPSLRFSLHHSTTAAERRADDPAAICVCFCLYVCVCVCVCVLANGYTTNSLSDIWLTASMLRALQHKVHVGCKLYRAVMADIIHFIALLCRPFL